MSLNILTKFETDTTILTFSKNCQNNHLDLFEMQKVIKEKRTDRFCFNFALHLI